MFEAFSNLQTNDNTAKIMEALAALKKMDVLVGIPEADTERKDPSITNAELAYIHTHGVRAVRMREEMQPEIDKGTPYSKAYEMYIKSHGSPLWHSPPRPIIEPAIEAPENKQAIATALKDAAKAGMDGNISEARKNLEKAGMIGQNAARGWFVDSRNGWAPNSPDTVEKKGSDRPLIDTGELRKSIIYVVREKDG